MIERLWIPCLLLCLTGAACSGPEDASSDATGTAGRQTADQQTPAGEPANAVAWEASEVLLAQSAVREEFDGWDRDAADESKPIKERQAAVSALSEHALRVSDVEQKPWGTVRHQLIDQESAKVLRRLATSADEAEIRTQAIETLGQLRDIDGMDALLAGLEDESLGVREAARGAMHNTLSTDFGYRADAAPAERAQAVASARRFWGTCLTNARFVEGIRNPALLKKWKKAARWKEDAEPRWREPDEDR